jgi:hypothetical protein
MSDWYSADPVSSAPLKITVNPASAKSDWFSSDPVVGKPGVAEDVAKSIPSGLAKGAAGLVGLPGDIQSLMSLGLDWVEKTARQEGDTEFAKRIAERKARLAASPPPNLLPTSQTARGAVESVTGKLYEPQTLPGKFTGKISEFVPGAIAGGGGARNLVNFAVAPAIADEAAGQLTEGSKLEPYARAGAAIATGGAASILNRPSTAERALRGGMSQQVTPQIVNQAEQLVNDAAARGVRLTWAEAIEQVAPGSGLTNTQRVVESSPGGREVMSPFMAQRPQQIENAARGTFDTVAPPNAAPSTVGPAVGNASNAALSDVRQRINQTAQPFYDAASTVRLTPAEMRRVVALPGYQEARDAVRNNPQLNRYVAQLPDDSVGFLNEVKKQLDQQSQNAASRFTQNRNQQVAAGYGNDASAVRGELTNAYFGNPARNYETALNIESAGRQRFLQPLMDGPLGKLAKRDATTQRAIEVLFPTNPVANSEHEITTAVRAVAARNANAARDLVRAHAETTFNEAAQALQGGANQFGGAKFATVIAGNPQQRANLEAAVRALPNGDQIWTGFNRFLEIAQATGTRQPKGSLTAFNAQDLKDLSAGGRAAGVAKMAGSPTKLLSAVSDAWSRWQLGRNVDELARILTDPNSGNLLRRIAAMPQGNQAISTAGRLILTAQSSRQGHARNQ